MMKMSSEGGDTRFPDNLRVPAKVVTGWGHKKKGVETLGRVAVKINGKGQKLWVFPAAIHSGKRGPPVARVNEHARVKESGSDDSVCVLYPPMPVAVAVCTS